MVQIVSLSFNWHNNICLHCSSHKLILHSKTCYSRHFVGRPGWGRMVVWYSGVGYCLEVDHEIQKLVNLCNDRTVTRASTTHPTHRPVNTITSPFVTSSPSTSPSYQNSERNLSWIWLFVSYLCQVWRNASWIDKSEDHFKCYTIDLRWAIPALISVKSSL